MSHVFSDVFAARDCLLARMDSRVKLLLAIELLCCVVLSHHVGFPLAVLACCMAASLTVDVPLSLVLSRLLVPFNVVLVLIVIQSLLHKGSPLWVVPIGAWKLTVTREGLNEGLLSGARVFGAVSVMLLLSLVTPIHRIFQAMRWMRVPEGWLEIAVLMYRYVFTLLDFAWDMTSAQELRLGYAGLKRGLKSMSEMIGTVIIRSVDQAVATHDAMVLRGYNGSMPFASIPPLRQGDLWILFLGGTFTAGFYCVLERNLF